MSSLSRRIVIAASAEQGSHVVREETIPANNGSGIGLTNLWLAAVEPLAKPSLGRAGFVPFSMQQMREPRYAVTLVDYPPGTGKVDPGMHATPTVDHFYVIEGEIVLVLEDGEAVLRAGDFAVVHGATHGWRNDGDKSARVLFFVLPTRR